MPGAKFDIAYVFDYFPKLLSTLNLTLTIVGLSILFGLGVGFLVALPRLYKVPVLKRISQVYVSFFRGTPILIQLFLIYYGLPELLKLVHVDVTRTAALVFVVATYSLNAGAFLSEMIRAGVSAVDRGQVEAAYSIGMSGFQAFVRIVLPQALAISLPVFANLVIGMIKDTSLAFSLGIMEMTGKAQTLIVLGQHFVETYIDLAIIYFVISFALEQAFRLLERRLLRHEQRESSSERRFGWKSPSLRGLLAKTPRAQEGRTRA